MLALIVVTAAIAYVVIAGLVIKRLQNKKARWVVLAVFILIPTWDEILGRIYFQYLCATEGGIRVYKTLGLPKEYWDEQGKPVFIKTNNLIDKDRLAEHATFTRKVQDEQNSLFRIRKTAELIADRNGEIVGELRYFIHFGGWLVNSTGIHVVGTDCPKVEDASVRKLVLAVFMKRD